MFFLISLAHRQPNGQRWQGLLYSTGDKIKRLVNLANNKLFCYVIKTDLSTNNLIVYYLWMFKLYNKIKILKLGFLS